MKFWITLNSYSDSIKFSIIFIPLKKRKEQKGLKTEKKKEKKKKEKLHANTTVQRIFTIKDKKKSFVRRQIFLKKRFHLRKFGNVD